MLQKGRIRLKLHISQNVPGQVLQQADGEVLAIDKQEIETQVEVRSGETIALGGIFSHKNKSAADSDAAIRRHSTAALFFAMMVKKMNGAS